MERLLYLNKMKKLEQFKMQIKGCFIKCTFREEAQTSAAEIAGEEAPPWQEDGVGKDDKG